MLSPRRHSTSSASRQWLLSKKKRPDAQNGASEPVNSDRFTTFPNGSVSGFVYVNGDDAVSPLWSFTNSADTSKHADVLVRK